MSTQQRLSRKERAERAPRQLEGESVPLYRRIEDDLRNRISTGEWKVGAMIDGRMRLSEEYNVHIHTVERAIKALVDDGTLETQGTRGTFVARGAHSEQDRPLTANNHVAGAVLERDDRSHWGEKLTRRRTIGIISTDDPVSRDSEAILRSVEKSLSNAGGSVIYINRTTPGQGVIPVDVTVARLIEQGCEALVVMTYNDRWPRVDEFEAMVGDAAIPLIYVSPIGVNRPIWNVYYDSVDAGFQAAAHLIAKGCTTLMYLAYEHYQWADERLAGIQDALRKARIGDDQLIVRFEDRYDENDLLHVESAKNAALETFAARVPQGIVATNDQMAAGVCQAAAQLGLVPGADFLLVGFDDSVVARSYGISSMRPPLDEMGQCASRLTVRALEGDPTCQRVCLSSHLIARTSTNGSFLGE
ncbi:MAG: GntR family transcriptional regulator [Capsulimonadaceae bacterium]|nr:GntR family transcriptional regulator [Capsulimonadaceae bacterium]